MENVQDLKKRLKSIGNINKITKAMELVAATKMRRAQEIALASRPYAFAALDLLANVSLLNTDLPELLKARKVEKTLFVLVASDKGLAGAFNSSVFKKFESVYKTSKDQAVFVTVGEKAFNYVSKKRLTVIKKFTNVGDFTTTEQVQPLADFLVAGYLAGDFDKVTVFSTHFRSALKQESLTREVLPITFESLQQTVKDIIPDKGKFADLIKEQQINFVPSKDVINEYLVEPSAKEVLADLAKHLFFMQMYHLILEANASEHAARRMAMKTASDNAGELKQALNLQYNKVRQSAITNQIIEIIAGAESLN
ncbi:MAG: ATP synthase F1 subunit gamma [Candidatus Staskawiczbacteria bacterium]|nr:ATP synthase F1 subunit gamma [Candidatus Staskawiczbacteria bacterium]